MLHGRFRRLMIDVIAWRMLFGSLHCIHRGIEVMFSICSVLMGKQKHRVMLSAAFEG